MGGIVDAIGGAVKDFADDPWSVAVPMYGLTRSAVKLANGSYAPQGQPATAPPPQAANSTPNGGRGTFGMAHMGPARTPTSTGFVQSMTPAAKPPEKAPFAGAWDYQVGKGSQWSGPKSGNRI